MGRSDTNKLLNYKHIFIAKNLCKNLSFFVFCFLFFCFFFCVCVFIMCTSIIFFFHNFLLQRISAKNSLFFFFLFTVCTSIIFFFHNFLLCMDKNLIRFYVHIFRIRINVLMCFVRTYVNHVKNICQYRIG